MGPRWITREHHKRYLGRQFFNDIIDAIEDKLISVGKITIAPFLTLTISNTYTYHFCSKDLVIFHTNSKTACLVEMLI